RDWWLSRRSNGHARRFVASTQSIHAGAASTWYKSSMKDKWLMIGVGATFLAFFLMIVSMMMLSRNSSKNKELVSQIPTSVEAPAAPVTQNYDLYKTVVGDDGRQMIEIPSGPFKMGSNDGYSD